MHRLARLSQFLAALLLALAFPAAAGAQSASASHAKVSLLAEENSFDAGHTIWIGLLFDLEKGWHIYWVNPGDSGAALRVRWSLPNGFKVGEIHWPVPSRVGKGALIDYGYEGRVLLPMQMRIPASYQSGVLAKLAADVRYMICRELVCMAAETRAKLSIPTAHQAAADSMAAHRLFQEALDHQPKSMPTSWKAQAFDDGTNFVLRVEVGAQITNATFFPMVANQLDNAAPQMITPTRRGVQITLKKAAQLTLRPQPISTLKGLVVLGPNQAYEIAAPLTAQ